VYANRKAYKRHQKHKGGNDYESWYGNQNDKRRKTSNYNYCKYV
jgi:hypothetical protein